VSDDGRGRKFGTVAEHYDLYRADTPEEATTLLGTIEGLDVLDVGAGTGKLTRFLLGHGAKVSVVEPDDDMRKILTRRSPEAHVLHGSAEAIPVADASFDAAFSSSAWHWFRQPDATNEMTRILRDNATLYVLWNGFSRDDPWTESLSKLRDRPDDPNARPRGWVATFDDGGDFVDVRHVTLDWTWSRTIDQLVGLFGTYSASIIQSDENKATIARKVREQLVERVGDPHASGEAVVEIAMTLRGTIARRRPR